MLDIAIHRSILIALLKELFVDQQVGPHLGFKGGTAVLLFYGLSRFSVDLDFDLLESAYEEVIFNRVHTILSAYGTVKATNKRYSLFYLLMYKDKLEGAQNIKIEINKRNFGSAYEIKHFLGIPMRVMLKEDMVANKLVAMHERIGSSNRDIFDVWFFFHNHWPVNKKIVELRTHKTYADFLRVCIHELEHTSNRSILSGIGELLDAKQKAWAKAHLKDETVFLLKVALDSEMLNG